MKNFFAFLLSAILFTIALPSAFAEEAYPELLLFGSFENAEEAYPLYSGGTVDPAAAFAGENGLRVSNPFGETGLGTSNHLLEYGEPLLLTEGRFYTFSAYVLDPMSDDFSEPQASASLSGNDTLFIGIDSVGGGWSSVSVTFMPMETKEYFLSVIFENGDDDIGFFVDEISLTETDRLPAYAALEGPDEVYVPDAGIADYYYNLVTYTSDGEPISVLIRDLEISPRNLPDGAEFDEGSGVLHISSSVAANETFYLTCSVSVGVPLLEGVKEITTTKNLLEDWHFENGGGLWEGEDIISSDGCLSLYASSPGSYGCFASVRYKKQLLLTEGNMYVFRADVKSEEEFSSSDIYIDNASFARSGYAEINITGIGGGDWSSVVSAFTVESSGIYELTLNLCAPSERPVYLDNVSLGIEESVPTRLSLHAPGNIQIPSETVTLPCYALVHDQIGNVMESGDIALNIAPKSSGVTISGGEITVTSAAKSGEYIISASCGELYEEISLSVSRFAVGDGGFEEREANEWWAASDGAVFSIVDYGDGLCGYVFSDEASCLVVNNSYMELTGGNYYVYSASAGSGRGCTVTAFIADFFSGEYLPIAQYDPQSDVLEPFSFSETIVGRLVLYIEAEDHVALTLDNIDISPSELTASDVTVSPGSGERLRGSYTYINNMTASSEADISVTRWYISSSPDGYFEPVGVPNQSYLECTKDMSGQYVLFEVTPVCYITGLVGDAVRSEPVLVSFEDLTGNDTKTNAFSEMKPVSVEQGGEHPFSDITAHWAETRIASLYNAGIVTGRSASSFAPGESVTRAEFTAMTARAFSLVSLPYSGAFSDVSEKDWYSGVVEAASKRGLVTGSGGFFRPNELITREEMAVIIYRAYLSVGGEAPDKFDLIYYDAFMISSWAKDSVRNVSSLGFFTGTDMNLFEPKRSATRAEAAAVIYRVLKFLQ